jgi:hypothetical protein
MSKKIDLSNSKMWQSLDWDEKVVHPNLKITDAQVNKARSNKLKAENPIFRETMALVQASSEYKDAVGKASIEHWQDPKYRQKNSEGKKRAWANDTERKEKVIEQFSQPKNETHKQNMSKSQLAFYQTPEGKKALEQKAEKQRGKIRKKETCPHCGKEGGEGIMKRWHFDNCKHK